MKSSGWYGEPGRHRLAALGVRSSESPLPTKGELSQMRHLEAKAHHAWNNMDVHERWTAVSEAGLDPNFINLAEPYHDVIDFISTQTEADPVQFEKSIIKFFEGRRK